MRQAHACADAKRNFMHDFSHDMDAKDEEAKAFGFFRQHISPTHFGFFGS